MGRHYYTQRYEGKFGFGTQPSKDPEIFGMKDVTEEEIKMLNIIDYYLEATPKTLKHVKDIIDVNYGLLDVYDNRKYEFNDDQEDINDYVFNTLRDNIFHKASIQECKEYPGNLFALDDDDTYIENLIDVSHLSACRLSLGLKIYNCLLKDGYCSMTAEL